MATFHVNVCFCRVKIGVEHNFVIFFKFDKPFRYTFDGHTFNENSLASMCTVKMVKMDKDSNNRKRKKTNDDNARNLKKFQWTRNGSGRCSLSPN